MLQTSQPCERAGLACRCEPKLDRRDGGGGHSAARSLEYAREVQPLPKMGPWRADLDRMLATNEAKSGRERLTLIRLFEG